MHRAASCLFGAATFLAIALSPGCMSGESSSSHSGAATNGGAGLLGEIQRRGEIVVATDANYRPQSFRKPDGMWEGFDIDVAREIAKRLGVTARFYDSNFEQVTAGNWNGRWDATIESMAITYPRAKVLWFSAPYYYAPASYAVYRTNRSRTLADIDKKRIGVGVATTYQAYLLGKVPTARVRPPAGAKVVAYSTDMLALKDLALGDGVKLGAVMSALPTIHAAIAAGMPVRIIEPPAFSDTLAIALDKMSSLDSRPLLWAIDSIVNEMHEDGTLTRLSMKYYGIDLTVRR